MMQTRWDLTPFPPLGPLHSDRGLPNRLPAQKTPAQHLYIPRQKGNGKIKINLEGKYGVKGARNRPSHFFRRRSKIKLTLNMRSDTLNTAMRNSIKWDYV